MTDQRPPQSVRVIWRKVHCPDCGRYLCAVAAGGVVRVKCPKCKIEIVKEAA